MKEENIQHKVDEIMKSLDNVQPAEASPFLYSKVMNRLHYKNNVMQIETRKFLRLSWELAFAMLFFIGLNIATFVYFSEEKYDQEYTNSLTTLANEFTINSNNYNYY